MVSSREFTFYFFVFFLIFFFSILSACSITGSVARSSMLSCYHGVQGKDAFYLTPRRPFKYSEDGEF